MATHNYDPSSEISQSEKRRIMREQGSTYLGHTHSELGGRFASTETQIVTGRPSPKIPQLPANSPWHGPDPVPDEPAYGVPIDTKSSTY
jgi:hypothetical protein